MPNNVALGNNLKSNSLPSLKWRRVVFKISGTALSGNCQSIDTKVAMQIAREIATACRQGVEIAIVVGGHNFFCGDLWISATGLDRPYSIPNRYDGNGNEFDVASISFGETRCSNAYTKCFCVARGC